MSQIWTRNRPQYKGGMRNTLLKSLVKNSAFGRDSGLSYIYEVQEIVTYYKKKTWLLATVNAEHLLYTMIYNNTFHVSLSFV
jgi:hypothetical protein